MGAKSLARPVASLYDEDFVIWTAETARLLRAGKVGQVDVEHVAEEIEDMGTSYRHELHSRLTVLLLHLLKWRFQPGKRSRSWRSTMMEQRDEIFDLFDHAPSLRRTVSQAALRIYPKAVARAATESGLPLQRFPTECPFSAEQILDTDFFPAP